MSKEDAYEGLLSKLNNEKGWPMVYLFKFIIPNDNQKLALVQGLFGAEAQVRINKSRTGKYLSISAKEMMLSPQEVVDRYKKASEIDGVIAL